MDWQALHGRDRAWRLGQAENRRWDLLSAWNRQFSGAGREASSLLEWTVAILGLACGVLLTAGLLEYTRFETVNLLWFMVIGVFLPFIWWLLGLLIAVFGGAFPALGLLRQLRPAWFKSSGMRSLVYLTGQVLAQQFSLLFAVGMVLSFLLYVLLTDLSFGWSSTLDLSNQSLLNLATLMARPWQQIWPDAVPGRELLELSRYFRSAPVPAGDVAALGAWWRFLFMCLVTYVLLPRAMSFLCLRMRLARMQSRLLENDALISGLWQRLSTELVSQEAETVDQQALQPTPALAAAQVPISETVLRWGCWAEPQWRDVEQVLARWKTPYRLLDSEQQDSASAGFSAHASTLDELLIVTKGWEPPTGELADLCRQIHQPGGQYWIWPAPLRGMDPARVQMLNQSWSSFMPGLPEGFKLLSGAGYA